MAGTAIEPRIRAPPPQPLYLHRHGEGLLVLRGHWLGGGGDHDLADLTAAPPHPRGEAADRGHGEAHTITQATLDTGGVNLACILILIENISLSFLMYNEKQIH